jgi:D-glycero-D-manno-heptose 1,7-bisphosphate phosphatase
MNKAVFLDKDGTLVDDVPYNVKPERVSYTAFAKEALRLLQNKGYLLIIVSNQSGIARGYFTEAELAILIDSIKSDMAAEDIDIPGFYYCPHYPDTQLPEFSRHCDCRKPAAGMIFQAAKDFNIDLGASWMIGDILNDMEAGKRAGCKTILLNVGNETEWEIDHYRVPDFYADNLLTAAEIIPGQTSQISK